MISLAFFSSLGEFVAPSELTVALTLVQSIVFGAL